MLEKHKGKNPMKTHAELLKLKIMEKIINSAGRNDTLSSLGQG